jgi:hypothetical protein
MLNGKVTVFEYFGHARDRRQGGAEFVAEIGEPVGAGLFDLIPQARR